MNALFSLRTPSLLAFAFSFALALGGCSQGGYQKIEKTPEHQTGQTEQAQEERNEEPDPDLPTVVFATKANYIPFEYVDENGRVVGFEADIVKAIAKDQGFNAKIRDIPTSVPWDKYIGMIDAPGDVDVLFAALARTPERAQRYGVTNAYSSSVVSAVWFNPDLNVKSPEDLKNYKVAVEQGYMEGFAKDAGAKDVLAAVSGYAALKAASTDKAQIALCDKAVVRYFLKDRTDVKQHFSLDIRDEFETMGMLTRKDNPELLKKLNDGIRNIIDNGEWKKINQKWFGKDFDDAPPAPGVF